MITEKKTIINGTMGHKLRFLRHVLCISGKTNAAINVHTAEDNYLH